MRFFYVQYIYKICDCSLPPPSPLQILHKVVEVSEVLERLELLLNAEEEDAEDGSGNILSDLEEVERCARRSNWELKFVYHFNNRRRRRKKL